MLVIQIAEPVTMVTDYALGLAGLYFAIRLLLAARAPQRRPVVRLWALGFAFSGLAALTGGTFHGFALMLAPSTLRSLWNVTMILIGSGGAFMVGAAIAASIHSTHESRWWLIRGVTLTIAGFLVQLTGFRHALDFNHNDAFHLIQIAAMYFFFRGAMLLRT